MGVSFSAGAAIGVCVRKSQLYRSEQVPGCACPVLVAGAKFCPQCGKPMTKTRRVPIAGYDDGKETVAGFPIVWATHEERGESYCVIGSLCVRAGGEDVPQMVAFVKSRDSLHDSLKAALEPLGLWDEKAFGLWAVPNVSY